MMDINAILDILLICLQIFAFGLAAYLIVMIVLIISSICFFICLVPLMVCVLLSEWIDKIKNRKPK